MNDSQFEQANRFDARNHEHDTRTSLPPADGARFELAQYVFFEGERPNESATAAIASLSFDSRVSSSTEATASAPAAASSRLLSTIVGKAVSP